ncbi:hypothetical protein [Litchfieldella rifensis]|uniref:Uncharacterized protein n=1 Tax=Litchfieldella rifensis TaxID=762643 RepID=A0ABV7LV77_9GAMM
MSRILVSPEYSARANLLSIDPDDLPFNPQESDPFVTLKAWDCEPIYHGIANCSPIDLNIPEAFPLEKLVELVRDFAQGRLERVLRLDVRLPPGLYRAAALLRRHSTVTDMV